MNRKILAVSVLSMLVLFSIAARAQNLFTNGDFEQGNTGFTTDYTYVPGNGTAVSYTHLDVYKRQGHTGAL